MHWLTNSIKYLETQITDYIFIKTEFSMFYSLRFSLEEKKK